MVRYYLVLFLISAALLIAVIAAMQSGSLGKIAMNSKDSYMDTVTIAHSADNTIKWRASVSKVQLTENEKKAKMKDITVRLTDGGFVINSANGTYDIIGSTFNLDGEVVASNKDYEIKSKDITWDFKQQTLKSDAGVTLKGSKITLSADSFRANKGELIDLYGNVTVVIN
ncbi:MAG: LPS export ABC transporter periplasmic protein LptC [Nitrospirae bacterium]|nr:LPS export ABC transporter periplasmic protein LptC [Nitrospirota bacterium]